MNPIKSLSELLEEKTDEPICKGKTYRARVNRYINSKDEYVYTERMIPLKRLSCPGCPKCGWMDDEIREHIDCETLIHIDIKDGATYSLQVTNVSTDWETGYVDDYTLEFIEIEDIKVEE